MVMGIFWIGLGFFFLYLTFTGQGGFIIPHINLDLGWIVIALGGLRIWWWKKTVSDPAKKRRELRDELRQMELEAERAEQEEREAARKEAEEKEKVSASEEADDKKED